ncbi:MAG TPA: nuclear transport factor 2 family protein, partial [Acidimicrobiales bacterium]|nr:nuclear transport factor 2 family protein [Acidimicrobiales bacterium]
SWLEMARSAADVGMLRYEMTPLAVRGDRLALVLFVPRGRDDRPDALSDQQLRLWGLDGEGKLALDVFFDLEDVDAAYAELDAQYLATEAQPHCNVFETIAAAIDAYNRRDAVAAPLAPDLVHVDHRPASLPDMNEPSGLVSYLGRTVEVVPDLTMRLTAVHVLDDRGAVFTIVQSGATPEGMPIEFSLHAADLVADGLIKRIEVFPEDALDAALARFAALGSADSGLENAATRAHARFAALFAQRDWAAAGENCSDNYVHDDRRAGLRNTFHGRDEAMALARGVADIGVKEFVTTVVATRGDRSALLRMRLVGRDRRPDAFHTEVLTLVAVNRDERITDWITFDLEDSEAAFAELDVRYLAGEGAPHADILAPMFGAMDVYNARDWQQAGLHVSAGISVVDHRPASMGAMTGSDEFLRALQVLVDLVPSMRVSCRAVHAVSEGAAVVQLSLNGTTGEGSEVELSFNVVYVAVDRRLTIWEYFPEDQLDVALARFAALGPVERGIENAATRAVDLWKPLFVERDWESLSRLIAEDILVEDRRHVMEYVSRGRTDYLEQIRALGDIGVADVEFTVLATRGDRSVLLRSRFVGRDRRPDAFSTVVLQVIEADNEGRLNVCVQFDIDDEDAAFAELNARYLAGEGAAHANTLGPLFEAMRLYNARDWLHIATGLADDFSMVDHRLASLEAVDGADEFIRSIQPLTDLAPSVRARARMIHAVGPGAAVVQMNLGGSTVDGSDIEFGFHTVCAVRAGQLTNWEFFAEDQLPAAQARFEELRGAGSDLENAAARAHNRFATKFVQRDWESVATVFTEDSVYDDRRRVLGGIYRGR